MQAEYNVFIREKIFFMCGIDDASGGGYNFFKLFTKDYLFMRKDQFKNLNLGFYYYEKDKKILFDNLMKMRIENILFKKEVTNYGYKRAWYYLFRYYWYLPYFYSFLIKMFIQSRFPFLFKSKDRIKNILFPNRVITQLLPSCMDPFLTNKFWWQFRNLFNETAQVSNFDHNRVFVGPGTKGELNVFGDEESKSILRIGENSIIEKDTRFFLNVSEDKYHGNILVGNNVIIGQMIQFKIIYLIMIRFLRE
jgi:hypothetical protein